jgi:hypothetical protein
MDSNYDESAEMSIDENMTLNEISNVYSEMLIEVFGGYLQRSDSPEKEAETSINIKTDQATEKVGGISSTKNDDSISLTEKVDDISSNENVDDISSNEKVGEISSTKNDDSISSTEKVDDISSSKKVDDISSNEKVGDITSNEKVGDISSNENVDDISSNEKVGEISSNSTKNVNNISSTEKVGDISLTKKVGNISSTKNVDDISSTENVNGIVSSTTSCNEAKKLEIFLKEKFQGGKISNDNLANDDNTVLLAKTVPDVVADFSLNDDNTWLVPGAATQAFTTSSIGNLPTPTLSIPPTATFESYAASTSKTAMTATISTHQTAIFKSPLNAMTFTAPLNETILTTSTSVFEKPPTPTWENPTTCAMSAQLEILRNQLFKRYPFNKSLVYFEKCGSLIDNLLFQCSVVSLENKSLGFFDGLYFSVNQWSLK